MLLLMGFALIAGVGTAITPCVLPVLPALLSAGATGGRRRPLGIVLGLVITFTITIVGVAKLVDGVGAGTGFLRSFAIAVLLLFGLSLLVPALGDRIEAPLSRLARFGPKSAGDGFWSGLGVGGALGFVCAPCAGPILAGVISVSASQGTSARLVGVALSYTTGLGAVLLLYALAGRRVTERIRRAGRGPTLQRVLGGVLLATALVMTFNLDIRFETALARDFPSFLVFPTKSLERSSAVESRLAKLRGKSKFDSSRASSAAPAPVELPGVKTPPLPNLGRGPDFTDTQRWFNTPGGQPLSLAGLRGKVVLVDFWTYTCINCIRTLPFLRGLDAQYRKAGLTLVGVHTPEFSFEHDAGNVAAAIRQNRLRYPVVQDNNYGTWNAYGNQFWPADYLIDASGNVRYTHFGEGNEKQIEAAVRALLAEAGSRKLGGESRGRAIAPSAAVATPETYLGTQRAERFLPSKQRNGTHDFPGFNGNLPLSHFALKGTWTIDGQSGTAVRRAQLDAQFQAAKVYLVLSSKGDAPRPVRVLVDGKPAGAGSAGIDVRGGSVTVRAQRLYNLVALPQADQHHLTLRFAPGVAGYAFTFG